MSSLAQQKKRRKPENKLRTDSVAIRRVCATDSWPRRRDTLPPPPHFTGCFWSGRPFGRIAVGRSGLFGRTDGIVLFGRSNAARRVGRGGGVGRTLGRGRRGRCVESAGHAAPLRIKKRDEQPAAGRAVPKHEPCCAIGFASLLYDLHLRTI
ncbi:hypothetical protein TSH64_27255 [Azospirillum sp. TSH64]|nr:hypothetical protein TSH64_27255 [Azospirillum sp. TSH64]